MRAQLQVGCIHDKDSNAIYIRFATGRYHHGNDLDPERRIDFDENGNPLGVELLCVSTGVDLTRLPEPSRLAKMLASRGVKILP